MATISIRQQIVTKVDTGLKAIKTTASYETSLGNYIHPWGAVPAKDDTLDCKYRDTDRSEPFSTSKEKHTLTINVIIFANSDTVLRQAISDVVKMFGANVYWGGLAMDSRKTGEDIASAQNSQFNIAAQVTHEIDYLTKRLDPYSQ